MLTRSLTQQIEDLRRGEYSTLELVSAYFQNIHQQEALNCFISLTEDQAMHAAAEVDAQRAKGRVKPLAGIPIAHKDIFCTAGLLTTAGSRMLHNFIAPYDATVVSKLASAGAIMLGKTNMDEFAMGSSNETSYYGEVLNPWHPEYVPGGSSGGSAAAVAAGLCSAATGTDTGGSIRQPAAFCGITGLKPTYGRVSRWGMIAYASSLEQAGPLARSAEECALLLGYMAGSDRRDSTSAEHPVDDYMATLNDGIKGIKIGLCEEYMASLDTEMAQMMTEVAQTLEQEGAMLQPLSLPSAPLAIPAYYLIAPAECSSNLSRYDGVRYGYRCPEPVNLADLYQRSRSEAFGTEVKHRILVGTFALSAGYYDAYYKKAQQIRRLIKNDFERAFNQVDVILAPTTPGPAFRLGEKSNDPLAMYQQDIFTTASNLAGLPALSMPSGQVTGLPLGAQLIGNYFEEATLLRTAHQYQQATDWHLARPPSRASQTGSSG